MIIKSRLLFYNLSKFKELKSYFNLQDKEVLSITKFALNEALIEEVYGFETIIDITALSNINNQYVSERLISLFDDTFDFIADEKHKSFFEKELRFCFSDFKVFEEYSQEDDQPQINDKKSIVKNHKKIVDLEPSQLEIFFKLFNETLYGHNKFKDDFRIQVDNFRVFNKLGEHKILSLFLMGDSGVGKTEVARAIHKALEGQNKIDRKSVV